MSAHENKALARRVFEEVWNKGNLAVADEVWANNFVGHAVPDEIKGPEGVRQFFSVFRSAFPDLQFTIEDQIAEGDKVVTRWTLRGTHEGEFQGIAPTGKQMAMTGITVQRIAGGRIVEGWTNRDALGMLVQLGVVPPPGQAGG